MLCDSLQQDVETDGGCRDGRPGIDGRYRPVITNAHAAQTFDPTNRSFHHPTHSTEVAAVFAVAVPDVRLNPQPAEDGSRGVAVEARVGIEGVGVRARPPWLASHL